MIYIEIYIFFLSFVAVEWSSVWVNTQISCTLAMSHSVIKRLLKSKGMRLHSKAIAEMRRKVWGCNKEIAERRRPCLCMGYSGLKLWPCFSKIWFLGQIFCSFAVSHPVIKNLLKSGGMWLPRLWNSDRASLIYDFSARYSVHSLFRIL